MHVVLVPKHQTPFSGKQQQYENILYNLTCSKFENKQFTFIKNSKITKVCILQEKILCLNPSLVFYVLNAICLKISYDIKIFYTSYIVVNFKRNNLFSSKNNVWCQMYEVYSKKESAFYLRHILVLFFKF